MAGWMNKHIWTCFFLVYFGSHQTLSILGEKLSAPPHFQVVNVSSLQPKPYCQSSSSGGTIGWDKLEMVYRYGPCYPNGKTPTSEQLQNWDKVRVGRMNKNPPPVPINNDHGYYTVNIGLGTPRQNFNLLVDTGSRPSWVRCKSYTKGYKPVDPFYDRSKSSSYTNNTTSCKGPFSVDYFDKSSIHGIWVCDTLTGVEDVDASIMKFRFGCGEEIDGDFGDAAGILGLGRGESSLTSQISSSALKHMFSYYIPKTSSHKGDLLFGNKAKTKSDTCANQFTPLVKGNDDSVYYYVDLVGISVAGNKLKVSSTTLITSRGTIIDSGTVITRLPQVVYSALRAAFRHSMSNYRLLSEKVDGLLDTCYSLEGYKNVTLPDITFHFGKGTTVDVTLSNPAGIVWTPHDTNGKIMCLAFASAENQSIIGNVQQRGLNVIYDLEMERIGFGTNCVTS